MRRVGIFWVAKKCENLSKQWFFENLYNSTEFKFLNMIMLEQKFLFISFSLWNKVYFKKNKSILSTKTELESKIIDICKRNGRNTPIFMKFTI